MSICDSCEIRFGCPWESPQDCYSFWDKHWAGDQCKDEKDGKEETAHDSEA